MGICCDKDWLFSNNSDKADNETIFNKRWRTNRQIDTGSYSVVYQVQDLNDKTKFYAMKTEEMSPDGSVGTLKLDTLVLEQLAVKGKSNHFPQLIDKGRVESNVAYKSLDHYYIVMTLFGPNLEAIRKNLCKKGRMLPSTVAIIGIQMIEAIEDLHLTGFIHGDIKPHNLMIGLGSRKHNIYLLDFSWTHHYDKQLALGGYYPPYCMCTNLYGGCDCGASFYSRQGDMWCLFRCLVCLRKGDFPWEHLDRQTDEEPLKLWLNDIEPEYLIMYEKIKHAPDNDVDALYSKIKNMFSTILQTQGLTVDSPFEWEESHPQFQHIDKKKLINLFREN